MSAGTNKNTYGKSKQHYEERKAPDDNETQKLPARYGTAKSRYVP